jgi:hypothetical protein
MFQSAKKRTFVTQAQNVYKAVENQMMMNEISSSNVNKFCYANNEEENPVGLKGNKVYYLVETKDNKIVKIIVSNNEYSMTIVNPTEIDITNITKDTIDSQYKLLANCETQIAYTPEECFLIYEGPGYILGGYFPDGEECPYDVVIPPTINGVTITIIKKDAFRDRQITGVVIPNTITEIEEGAFEYNQLSSLIIPDSVTTIGNSAFANNIIEQLKLSNAMTSIPQMAFYNNRLTSLFIPNNITSVGAAAFYSNYLTSETTEVDNNISDFYFNTAAPSFGGNGPNQNETITLTFLR